MLYAGGLNDLDPDSSPLGMSLPVWSGQVNGHFLTLGVMYLFLREWNELELGVFSINIPSKLH